MTTSTLSPFTPRATPIRARTVPIPAARKAARARARARARAAFRAAGIGTVRALIGVALGVKGDKVEVVIDAGGATRTYEVAATRAGRRVEVRTGRGVVEVTELTRGGTPVRTARFMASRVGPAHAA